jgi:hypothetical protein
VRCSALSAAALAAAPAAAGGPAPFTQEAQARGVVYQMANYPLSYGYLGWGSGFADLDSDGDPDILVLGALDAHVGVFENDGSGNFIDRTAGAGIPPLPSGSGFAAADYDGDGDLDVYFTQVGESANELYPNLLMRNDGGFHFTDVTAQAGVGDMGASKGPCWGDFDNDGWVDLYVPNYNGIVPGTELMSNRLYRNLGNGAFEDVGPAQGVNNNGYGFQAVWFDYDRDGDVDLYLSNDRGHLNNNSDNQLWRNDGGVLVNVSVPSGAGVALFSMGVACGDFDANGWADLYVTNIPGGGGYPGNPLLLNLGNGTFVEAAQAAGVQDPQTAWGAIFFDYDNNTTTELYVNNMWAHNVFYVNLGGFPCVEMAQTLGINGPLHTTTPPGFYYASFCSAIADVDGDGDVDMIENNLGENVRLYINNEGSQRNWMSLRIVGEGPNTFAIGARVEATLPGRFLLREVLAGGNGYLGQNDLNVHMGLDDQTSAQEVLVSWPGGNPVRMLTGLPANQRWTIYPPSRLGDAEGDGDVDAADFRVLAGCLGLPLQPGCEMMDFDGNSQIDAGDADAFLERYAGSNPDCDGDLQPDLVQILLDGAADSNANLILDACEAMGDVNGDGVTSVSDLIVVITLWGPCGQPCLGDANGDGVVDVQDLVVVLFNWTT